MAGFIQFCRTIGAARLAAMGAVAVGLIGFFIFLILRMSAPQMTTLFTELPIDDSSAVVRKLEALNVPFELRNEGSTVLVPKERVLRLRMALAEEGLPAGGMVGYEIFDKGDTLGATSFVQNLNHLRALEGELARTIRSIDRVQMARVHLVLPERQLFARDKSEPSASIVLKMRGGLDRGQIRAIQHLVASAVKDLKPTHVSVVDENGTLLASGAGNGNESALLGSLEERDVSLENRLTRQISDIVTSVVGVGNARVQVNAEIDYNRVTTTSDIYDPEGRVVRSTQTREESTDSRSGARNEGVTVGNELPGGAENAQAGTGSSEAVNKAEEVVNYEISRTTKTQVTEAGSIKRISVAVLVDGIYDQKADGSSSYQPRSQEQLDQIATLVRSAIGFDEARGDQVEVVNLQFAPTAKPAPLEQGESSLLDLSKSDYFYMAELFTLLVISLLVLLFVIRPLVRRIITPEEHGDDAIDASQLLTAAGTPQIGEDGEPVMVTGPDGEPQRMVVGEDGTPVLSAGESKAAALIDFAQVAGEVHSKTVKKVADLVRTNPDEALAILRQWMDQEAA